MERFLGLLEGEALAPVAITPANLFDGVQMASRRNILRRAAIIFAGRLPTDAEYESTRGASAQEFRAAIRDLMQGPEFHEFLVRGGNDRLLTDREGIIINGHASNYFVDFSNRYYEKALSGDGDLWSWYMRAQHGFRRAPLELIAHVGENDLPYTDILTADYIMANAIAAEAYGANTPFDGADRVHDFRPSEIVSYYRNDESKVSEYSLELGTKVTDPGNLATVYPHAGILNTTVFLNRYPTTATNRNRARSRWTYYQFLGLDIEKSASRTTDPVALADTNNPTMHNPACTVCHTILDPVAGAFQNYGDEGLYRDQWGGMDSLDGFYKSRPAGSDHEVHASSDSVRETADVVTATGWLAAGHQEIGLATVNEGDGGSNVHVDYLTIKDELGVEVGHYELEDFVDADSDRAWDGRSVEICCEVLIVPVEVPSDGTYMVEIGAWLGYQWGDGEGRPGTLRVSIGTPVYRQGDTWYRDMREPGFDGAPVPDADYSLQWLARRIVEDERFGKAAVRFWWATIMGSDVEDPPGEESDADFEGGLLAATAQAAEVDRLATGFRRGFGLGTGRPHNLRDLLVEMVLSRWFRSDAMSGGDSVRTIGLDSAGARRLLGPEELARKTLAITGFQWGRIRSGTRPWRAPHERQDALADIRDGYGLLYGGIDSDGVTARATDLTSVMAGVAQSHALQTSCPVVMKELYLLPDGDQRLFSPDADAISPAFEFGAEFEIEASAEAQESQTVSLRGPLRAGELSIVLSFVNGGYDEETDRYRHVRLDRLDVRGASGEVVVTQELEDLDWVNEHNRPWDSWYWLRVTGAVRVPLTIPLDGEYVIEVVTSADQAGDELARLEVLVESDTQHSVGAKAIQSELAALYGKLLGVSATPDSPEVRAAYDLFVDVWGRRRDSENGEFLGWNEGIECAWGNDQYYLDGIVDDAFVWRDDWEWGEGYGWDWEKIGPHFDAVDWSDPHGVAETWAVVLAYLMMDYRYLYL